MEIIHIQRGEDVKTWIMKKSTILISILLVLFSIPVLNAQDQVFLMRSIDSASVTASEISTETAHYKPLFGAGDKNASIVKGIKRFGQLVVESGGNSKPVSYEREEQIYFILDGTGVLNYGKQEIPVSRNDFMYLPAGVRHGLSNPRESELKVIIMGYEIPGDRDIAPTEKLNLASADDVPLLVLGDHGPSTRFKLLMGTTSSERDRIAATYQVNSLFMMDFAPGGTNIPHRHKTEEEIYYILRGSGEIVAGGTPEDEKRHVAKEGDAFFFTRDLLIGFYSGTHEGEPHAQILAVRSK